MKLRHFDTPGYGNPWCYVFDDGAKASSAMAPAAAQHWDSPLCGAVFGPAGMDAVFDTDGMRPCVGNEFLFTRQFPDNVQGQFMYSCVINMNGMPRCTFATNRRALLVNESFDQSRRAPPRKASRCPMICWLVRIRTSGLSMRKSARMVRCGLAIGAMPSSVMHSTRSATRIEIMSTGGSIAWFTRRIRCWSP